MLVFFDIETTGTAIIYDQILQFAAILVDNDFAELDRFEIRCRLLPWIVPAPSALLVTGISVSRLEDPLLPDFFAMMAAIAEWFARWAPVTFIGYNSMRFDEPILQRAFWQALFPPYVTVTGGNARLDLLPILRAAAWFRPEILDIPLRDDGMANFRLDVLAPANGFDGHRAHDAMGDAKATLFLARRIARDLPSLWQALVTRASKSALADVLAPGNPVFLFHYGGAPSLACYQRIDTSGARGSHAVLARLGYDWKDGRTRLDDSAASAATAFRGSLRRVALNRAPIILTPTEVETLCGVVPSSDELTQGQFLARDSEYCLRLVEAITLPAREKAPKDAEVEETIFDAFASPHDELLMARFQRSNGIGRALIAKEFMDERFRRLALRILYVTAPHLLTEREMRSMRFGIARRLGAGKDDPHAWRSLADAFIELDADPELAGRPEAAAIRIWLEERLSLIHMMTDLQ